MNIEDFSTYLKINRLKRTPCTKSSKMHNASDINQGYSVVKCLSIHGCTRDVFSTLLLLHRALLKNQCGLSLLKLAFHYIPTWNRREKKKEYCWRKQLVRSADTSTRPTEYKWDNLHHDVLSRPLLLWVERNKKIHAQHLMPISSSQ